MGQSILRKTALRKSQRRKSEISMAFRRRTVENEMLLKLFQYFLNIQRKVRPNKKLGPYLKMMH